MLGNIRLYGTFLKLSLKGRMEYKFSFFSSILANFYCYFITYLTYWVITQRFGTISGWEYEDLVILYGLNLFTYSIACALFFNSALQLEREITTGRLDGYLVRPMGLIQQLLLSRIALPAIGQIIVSLIFVVTAFIRISWKITVFGYFYFCLSVLTGALLQSGAMILIGSLSFWMLRTRDLAITVYYDLRSFINYPIVIFPLIIRILLTYVFPWAFINYYPCLIILSKAKTQEEYILGLLSPIVSILFFLLSLCVFHHGLHRYSSSGS
ncbi:MAG: ABC transporter permease [Ruminiclostridium sp.]|nr:ABC transporter permease [Ruminiclostridium sp.]